MGMGSLYPRLKQLQVLMSAVKVLPTLGTILARAQLPIFETQGYNDMPHASGRSFLETGINFS